MYACDLQIDLLKILLKRGCQVRSDKSFKEGNQSGAAVQTLCHLPLTGLKAPSAPTLRFYNLQRWNNVSTPFKL